jgi:hypothetical protein
VVINDFETLPVQSGDLKFKLPKDASSQYQNRCIFKIKQICLLYATFLGGDRTRILFCMEEINHGAHSMKYFQRIEMQEIAIAHAQIKAEIECQESLWTADESRQRHIKVQRHTQSIPLRMVNRRPNDPRRTEDIHESKVSQYASIFPRTMMFLNRTAFWLGGTLERAMFARLVPHSVVYPHIDDGLYYSVRDRYHFVISSPEGSSLKAGDEEVLMHEGELWKFDNKAMHESENCSDLWRVHLIFDVF